MPLYANLTEDLAMSTMQYASLWAFNVLELIIHLLLSCPFSALNFALIWRTSILHSNLKFILLAQSFSIFARSFFRIIIVSMRFSHHLVWNPHPALIFMFAYSAYFRNMLAHVLVIERCWATVAFANYEWSRKPNFTVAWMLVVNTLTFVNCLDVALSEKTTFFNLLIYALLFMLAILEVAMIIWLWRHNDRIYRTQSIQRATLSERYQLAENIRTAKQLLPVLLIHFFNISLGIYMNWTVFYRAYGPIETNKFDYEFINQIYMCIMAGTNFLIEIAMILCHPYLKRNFLITLASIHNFLTKLRMSPNVLNRRIGPSASLSTGAASFDSNQRISLTSVRGEELMIPSGGTEADEYFRQLRQLWERIEISGGGEGENADEKEKQ